MVNFLWLSFASFRGCIAWVFLLWQPLSEHCKQATTRMPWHFRYGLQMSIIRWWRSFRSMMATTAVHIKCQAVSISILRYLKHLKHLTFFQIPIEIIVLLQPVDKAKKRSSLGKHWLAGVFQRLLEQYSYFLGKWYMEMISTLTCGFFKGLKKPPSTWKKNRHTTISRPRNQQTFESLKAESWWIHGRKKILCRRDSPSPEQETRPW